MGSNLAELIENAINICTSLEMKMSFEYSEDKIVFRFMKDDLSACIGFTMTEVDNIEYPQILVVRMTRKVYELADTWRQRRG